MTNIFTKILSSLKNLFTKENLIKIQKVDAQISSLVQFALPVVKTLNLLKGNKTIDAALQIAEKFNVNIDSFNASKITPNDVNAIIKQAALNALEGNLQKAVLEAGVLGLKVGSDYIKDHSQISSSILSAAIELAYNYVKASANPPVPGTLKTNIFSPV